MSVLDHDRAVREQLLIIENAEWEMAMVRQGLHDGDEFDCQLRIAAANTRLQHLRANPYCFDEIPDHLVQRTSNHEFRSFVSSNGTVEITGYGSVYERPYKVREKDGREYFEIVHRGAFADDLADDPFVVFNIDHDNTMKLGSTLDKSLRLSEDSVGLKFRVDVSKVDDAILTLLQKTNGCSVSFDPSDEWFDQATNTRHIVKASLFDVCLAGNGANPWATAGLDDESVARKRWERLNEELALWGIF